MKYAAALAALLISTSVEAATISIGYELPSISPGVITMVGQAVDPANGTLTVNGFGANTWTVNASGWAPTTTHLVGNVFANGGDPSVMNSFSVYITLSDITAPTGPVSITNDMKADFGPFPFDGWTLNFTTYINPSNIIFGKQAYLNGGPQLFSAPTSQSYVGTWDIAPGTTYSITQFYGFVDPPAPVPIPAVGLPGLGMFLAGSWLLWWRRRSA